MAWNIVVSARRECIEWGLADTEVVGCGDTYRQGESEVTASLSRTNVPSGSNSGEHTYLSVWMRDYIVF